MILHTSWHATYVEVRRHVHRGTRSLLACRVQKEVSCAAQNGVLLPFKFCYQRINIWCTLLSVPLLLSQAVKCGVEGGLWGWTLRQYSTIPSFDRAMVCISVLSMLYIKIGSEFLSRYSDSLHTGRAGDRIPVGAKFSAPVQIGPGAHPAPYTMSTWSFPGVKRLGRDVDHTSPSSAKIKEK